MKQRRNKLDKKTKLQRLKRYANGENLAEEVLEPLYRINLYLVTSREQKERMEKGEGKWIETRRDTGDYIEMIHWHEEGTSPRTGLPIGLSPIYPGPDDIVWEEIKSYDPDDKAIRDDLEKQYPQRKIDRLKTYPDPEIEGVSYSNPANVPDVPNSPDKVTDIKEVTQSENPKESQAKPNRKQFLQQRLMEFAEQERIDLEIKSKEDFWIYANRSF